MPENDTPILSPGIADKWAKVRLAHEAMMLDDAMELLNDERAATRQHRATMLTDGEGNPPPEDGGDVGRGVHIGDMIYHCVPPTAPAPQASPAVTPAVSVPQSTVANGVSQVATAAASKIPSWLKTAILVGVGAVSGGTVPYAGAILNWLMPDSPPAVVQPAEPTPAAPPSLDHGGVTIGTFKVQE